MTKVNFQYLDVIKHPLIKPIYKAHYPSAKPKKNEDVIVGYCENKLVSVVRFRPIEQYSLLTGMLVIPDFRGQGVGSKLLQFCQSEWISSHTFCFAYQHLENLYQSVGFHTIDKEELPPCLLKLFERYTANGKKLLPMHYKS
ncbi:MAG: GNAT family N-acetyltransferase [Vibrio sp.]